MSETLDQTKARIAAFVQENAPLLDISPGSVFNELLINTEAQVQNYVKNDVLSLSAAQTIAAALASATDTYSPIIDAIASNYNIVRNSGTYSSGVIRVTISSSSTYTIPAGTQFVQPLLGFIFASTVAVSPTISSQTLISNNQGGYYFDVPVAAQNIGANTAINTGTQFNLVVPSSIQYFVSAQAFGNFTAGQNQENDKQLIDRMRSGMSAKNLTSSDAIASEFKTAFTNFQSLYLADFNQAINLRASNNPLQIKQPGCVDVYVRNGVTLASATVEVPTGACTLTNNGGSSYTLNLVPDSTNPIYGFYRVLSVQVIDPNASTSDVILLPFTTSYGVASSVAHNVQSAAEARFSIYQTASVDVSYSRANPLGAEPTFIVTVALPQNLYDMQSMISDPAVRLPNADYLVKGVVPCIASVNVTLLTKSAANFIANSRAKLQADIFNYINNLELGQPIAVSQIANICHSYSDVVQVRLPIVLSATILLPYDRTTSGGIRNIDSTYLLKGTDTLSIPDLPQLGVNSSNTAFFTNYFTSSNQENINITVN